MPIIPHLNLLNIYAELFIKLILDDSYQIIFIKSCIITVIGCHRVNNRNNYLNLFY